MKKLRAIMVVAALCSLSGCATTNKDPLEGLNRGIYKFNDVADRYAIKPVAKAYKAVAPSPVRTGVSNFFSNLGSLTTIVNDLLQFKFEQAFSDAGRLVINTTFGILGFIDVASMDNIPKHNEDFGQTLGYWGVGSGAYLVLPLLGPSTVRDASGFAFDTFTSDPVTILWNKGQYRAWFEVRAAQFIDKRTQLLDATDLIDDASLDPYAFMRDAYLQRRASQVQDGLVPKELLQDDFEPADDEPETTDVPKKQSALPVESQDPSTESVHSSQMPAQVEGDSSNEVSVQSSQSALDYEQTLVQNAMTEEDLRAAENVKSEATIEPLMDQNETQPSDTVPVSESEPGVMQLAEQDELLVEQITENTTAAE